MIAQVYDKEIKRPCFSKRRLCSSVSITRQKSGLAKSNKRF